jgi:hypothetical protein
LSCSQEVSLGAWGSSGAGAQSGASGASASVGGSGASSGSGGSGTTTCPRPGVPGPLNGGGAELEVTNTYTDFTWSTPFDSIEWDLQLEKEPVTQGHFWSHGFNFVGSSAGIFFGVQSRGGYQADPPDGKIETADMVVFWISSSLRAELGDVAYPQGRTYLKPDSGSDWWTIHVLYDLKTCRLYHLRVARQALEANGDIWYGAWIRDGVTNLETFVGRILVPAAWGQLTGETEMWSTRIGFGAVSACSALEPVSALFGFPTANRGALTPTGHSLRFQSPARCASSRFTEFPDAVRHELGVAP